ncbi:GNAT family N-acetyltransferase [Blautia pseudococcoides]|nr:GNAT family N-acetyltransferase [Blautia pseudococcoides]
MILRMAGREDCEALTEMRMAFLEDEHGCLACEKDAVMHRQILGYFESHLGQDLYAFTAVDRCGKMAASAFLMITERPAMPDCLGGKAGTVFNVYTKPGYRRQGMAYRLMEMLLRKAEEAGGSYVDLKATKDGYGLYRKLGFEENTSAYTDMRYWVGESLDG